MRNQRPALILVEGTWPDWVRGRKAEGKMRRVTIRCAKCGEPFAVPPSEGYRKFCSLACYLGPGTFASKYMVNALTGCWEWSGTINKKSGYGYFYDRKTKKTHIAHIYSYRLSGRSISAGLDLDHLCRNRRCVNPDHLEPVTRGENVMRGLLIDNPAARTHCKRGHPWSPSNTYRTRRGHRMCKQCRLLATKRYRGNKNGA